MNFEKIELYGFKSFADKAEIKFGNGITGIVGPNGCGKSNVADAIRWVLGEQSAKSLRGSNMQDVIFAGTQGRKSLSYCEVSLYFDNSNKMFSIDYSEVIITRKLYRSGESEYFINKQPARLKDIVDLLHECGIGKEGYSIIGQGKVEEIMSAKPEDRRLIFEEATGIAKNKAKKLESERKLERTHANVLNYSNLILEIEKQLTPLERQAEKAKEFNALSEELKHHELNTYVVKVETVESTKAKYFEKIKGINEESDLRRSEMEQAEKEYEGIFSDIEKADSNLQKLNDELLEKRVSMEKSSGARQLYEQKISYMVSQIERAENDIKTNLKLIEDCKKSSDINDIEKEKAEKELKELLVKADEISKRLLTVSEKIAVKEEISEANRRKVIESLENLTDIKVNKGTISIERNNLKEKLDELTLKADELSVKRDGLFNEKDRTDKAIDDLDRNVFELKNKIAEKEDEVRSGNESVAKVENQIYSLNSVITSLTTRDSFYRAQKENYEGFTASVKTLLTNAKNDLSIKKRIKGVVAEIIKNDRKFDIALETALAAAAQNVVTENEDDAKFLIRYLKDNEIGRVTFLPITSVKPRETVPSILLALNEQGALGLANEIVTYDGEYENVISNLLGNTLIVDNIDNATEIAKKYRFGFKIVTLEGEVFATQGSITGGAKRKEATGVLSNDRRIEENAKLLKEKQAEMEKLKGSQDDLSKVRDKSLDELTILNELYNSKRQEILLEREKQRVTEENLAEIGREMESVTDLIEDLNKRVNEIDEKYAKVSSGSKKLEEDKESAEKDADIHQAEFDKMKEEQSKLLEESTALQVKTTELKGKIASLKTDNERLSKAINDAEESNKRLNESNDNAREIIESLKLDQEKVALTKEEQDYVNSIRDKISSIEKEKTKLKEKLAVNDDKKQKIAEQLDSLSEKKHNEEIALAKIDSDLEYLQQSIFEDYQETYETAVKIREEGYDAVKGEAEIDRIRKKRASLGAINAEAIEDYKNLKAHYEDMTIQRDDLLKGEEDLKKGISEIKEEMLGQFNEGFEKINENFKKIFKELFGGGRAMLELDYTDAVDKLDAGIEIIAEPPGKKLQKLSLLSGGEKALTAIAILFAILKMRPMPFCVLDEIEAALDEANVDRFARYLQKFSLDTQFIVITHRKPTMEKADALFGVTMQEKGVSKMVSVKLSDIADIDSDAI